VNKRLIFVIGITAVVLAAATSFTISRMMRWHQLGWVGAVYSPIFPGQKATKPQKMSYGSQPGEVLITYARSPADGKLLAHDIILSINGVPVEDVVRLRTLNDTLPRTAPVTFKVKRGNATLDVPMRFESPFRTPYVLIKCVVAFIVAVVFLFVALIVFARRPDDRRALVFYAFSLVSAVALIGSAATIYDNAAGRGIIMTYGFGTFGSLILFMFSLAYAPLILHLSLIFPNERPIVAKRPKVIHWIYAGAVLAALICIFFGVLLVLMIRSMSADTPYWIGHFMGRWSPWLLTSGLLLALGIIWSGRKQGVVRAFALRPFLAVFALFAIYLSIVAILGTAGLKKTAAIAGVGSILLPLGVLASYPIFACVALVRSYRAAGVEEKRQVQWPLWGLLIALLFKIVAATAATGAGFVLTLTRQSMIEWRIVFNLIDIVPTLVTLVVPLSFAAAILKYRLMNIDVIIRKTVVYALLSGTVIVFYLGMVGGLGTLLVNVMGLRNQTMVIASTLVVALLFVPMRNRLQTLVDRNLFRHRYDYPEALRAITTEGRTASDPVEFLTSVAEKLQRALQNRAVVIFAERQDELVATAKIGVSDSILGRLRVPRTFLDDVDRPFDPRRRALPDVVANAMTRIEAVLVVPVGSRGFTALASKLSGGEFDVEDVDFLRSASEQIAIAIDRMRMEVDEEDFAQARAIQQTLLPRELPRIAKLDVAGTWQPARTMGGDYYDVIRLGDNELALCIGDVAGKGMPAALLMSGLQAAVRASASSSPRDLCERVRRVVVSSLSGGRFVTFFYATLDTAAMRLRWCNAGHNAPILVRKSGSILRLEEGGPAISRLFRDTAYVERELALEPGDRLVLFTDGLSEAGDSASGDVFGESRVENVVVENRVLPAAELQQQLVDAALSYGRGELEDDLTLVVAALEG